MVARKAHNLEVAGSNPASATRFAALLFLEIPSKYRYFPGRVFNNSVPKRGQGRFMDDCLVAGRDTGAMVLGGFCGISSATGSTASCEKGAGISPTLSPEQPHTAPVDHFHNDRSSNPPLVVVAGASAPAFFASNDAGYGLTFFILNSDGFGIRVISELVSGRITGAFVSVPVLFHQTPPLVSGRACGPCFFRTMRDVIRRFSYSLIVTSSSACLITSPDRLIRNLSTQVCPALAGPF